MRQGGRTVDHGAMTDTTITDSKSPVGDASRPGYAIGLLTDVVINEDLLVYMSQVESTMSSFGGRWLVHGTPPDVREGSLSGDVVIIAFPDLASARAWYESTAYQDIVRLRTENSTSWIALLDGVVPGYTASSTIQDLRAAAVPGSRGDGSAEAGDGSEGSPDGFLPAGFIPPISLMTERFRLEPLGPEHNEADLTAWTSSIDHIRATPGYPDGDWPPVDGMTPERNMLDLQRHANDFVSGKGFTFTVLDPVAGDVIGCVYLYPAPAADQDVVVQSWVRADRAHLDGYLAEAVGRWIETDWPWKRVDYLDR